MDAQDGQDEGACCIFRRVTATLSSQVAVGLKKARSGSVGVLEAQEVLAVCGEKEVFNTEAQRARRRKRPGGFYIPPPEFLLFLRAIRVIRG